MDKSAARLKPTRIFSTCGVGVAIGEAFLQPPERLSRGPTLPTSGLGFSCTLSLIGSAPARDLFGVAGESAFRGNEASTVTSGLADRPAPRAPQVVDVRILGHAEKHEVREDRVRADEQIASEALVRFIVLKLILVHRENSGELSQRL